MSNSTGLSQHYLEADQDTFPAVLSSQPVVCLLKLYSSQELARSAREPAAYSAP